MGDGRSRGKRHRRENTARGSERIRVFWKDKAPGRSLRRNKSDLIWYMFWITMLLWKVL